MNKYGDWDTIVTAKPYGLHLGLKNLDFRFQKLGFHKFPHKVVITELGFRKLGFLMELQCTCSYIKLMTFEALQTLHDTCEGVGLLQSRHSLLIYQFIVDDIL